MMQPFHKGFTTKENVFLSLRIVVLYMSRKCTMSVQAESDPVAVAGPDCWASGRGTQR